VPGLTNGYYPLGRTEYLCMGPANSACILDKTQLTYGGDSETDEMVWV
jgi:hypothetical protein